MNAIQRAALAIAGLLMIGVIVLSDPLSGVEWQKDATPISRACTPEEADSKERRYRKFIASTPTVKFSEETLRDHRLFCDPETVFETAPLSDWRTKEPIIWWFGSIRNVLFAIVAIASAATFIVILYRDSPQASRIKLD